MQNEIPILLPNQPIFFPGETQPQADEAVRRLYNEVAPALVDIRTERNNVGSGFFVDNQGRVATAAHVVLDATQLFATTNDGRTYSARIEKVDDINDIAELQLVGFENDLQKHLQFADPGDIKVGESIYAFGFPHGLNPAYVSPGTVDKFVQLNDVIDRAKFAPTLEQMAPAVADDYTNALTSEVVKATMHTRGGNSGGPVVNLEGKVVGLTDMGNDKSVSIVIPASAIQQMTVNDKGKFNFLYGCSVDSGSLISHNSKTEPIATPSGILLSSMSMRDNRFFSTLSDKTPSVTSSEPPRMTERTLITPTTSKTLNATMTTQWSQTVSNLVNRFFPGYNQNCVPTLLGIERNDGANRPLIRYKSLPLS